VGIDRTDDVAADLSSEGDDWVCSPVVGFWARPASSLGTENEGRLPDQHTCGVIWREGESMTRRIYRGTSIEVSFDIDLCIHAAECIRGLSAVFDRDRQPWVLPNNATAEAVSVVVERCPTGALQYHRLDGESDEKTRRVTIVTPVENGPLVVRGDVVVRHQDGRLERLPRAALCRCGHSNNKPFCDNQHLEVGFQAPGAIPAPSGLDQTRPGAPS
jgi:uncharacterized Fe-S cluster protein YjdI/CDGSH-type Zn-finger protein